MPRWIAGTCCAFIGLLAVLVGLMADGEAIRDHHDLRSVHLGLPFNWVEQDQSGLDPPRYPVNHQFLNPTEHPAAMHGGFFLSDVVLFAAIFYGLYELLRRANRNADRRDRLEQSAPS